MRKTLLLDNRLLSFNVQRSLQRHTLKERMFNVNYTIPCASIALATFMKPATFAPLT